MTLVYGLDTQLDTAGLTTIRNNLYLNAVLAGWTEIDAVNKIVQHGADAYYVKFDTPVNDDDCFASGSLTKTLVAGLARWHIPVIVGTGQAAGSITGVGQGYYVSCWQTSAGAVPANHPFHCQYAMDSDIIAFYLWGDTSGAAWKRGFVMTFAATTLSPFTLPASPFWSYGSRGDTAIYYLETRHIKNPAVYHIIHLFTKSLGWDATQNKYYIDTDIVIASNETGIARDILGHFSSASQAVVIEAQRIQVNAGTSSAAFWTLTCYSDFFEITLGTNKFRGAKIHEDDYANAYFAVTYGSIYQGVLCVRSG